MGKLKWFTAMMGILIGYGIFYWHAQYGLKYTAVCRGCNVILIVIDSLRADALPCMGYDKNTAPNLCRFASNAVTFSHAYANATWTRPSNMSILTSLYPPSHGMVDPIPNTLNSQVLTIPTVLSQHGYTTTFVSNDDPNLGIELGYAREFQNIKLTTGSFTNTTLQAWLDAIDAVKRDNQHGKPAFIYFHAYHLHDYVNDILHLPARFPLDPAYPIPTLPPLNQFNKRALQLMRNYFIFTKQASWNADAIIQAEAWIKELDQAETSQQIYSIFLRLPEEVRDEIYKDIAQTTVIQSDPVAAALLYRNMYDESLRVLDRNLATIFDRISTNNLDRNTIVIVVSDHGQLLGESGLIGHLHGISQKEVHVPLIIRAPGIAAGKTGALTQHIDLFPTILDLVGVRIPKQLAGISLVGELLHRANALKNTFVISHTTIPFPMESIQTDRWRLVEAQFPNGTYHALYDLPRDPQELHSVAPENEPALARLVTLLHAILHRQPVYPPLTPSFMKQIN